MNQLKKNFAFIFLLLGFGLLFGSCFRKCNECPSFSQKKMQEPSVVALQGSLINNQ